MRRLSLLLAFVPLLGLVELGLYEYFAERAPDADDYAAFAPQLLKLKEPGVPVVVAPSWAEPLLRQAAPAAFPLVELGRADDESPPAFLEVSLLGASAPELATAPYKSQQRYGAFRVTYHENSRQDPTRFDFVSALEQGAAEVFDDFEQQLEPCSLVEKARPETGGLHGHVTYPRRRFECRHGRFVGVTLIDDQRYRPRRCVLAQLPDSGSVLLRFRSVPPSARLVGYVGASYFLERDEHEPQVELSVSEAEQPLLRQRAAGADGWSRFEARRGPAPGNVDVRLRRLARHGGDFCFSLEAR